MRAAAAAAGLTAHIVTSGQRARDESCDPSERYHLTATAVGQRTMHGWWSSETVARGKFLAWVGTYGSLPDARVVLVDQETGAVLLRWPDET